MSLAFGFALPHWQPLSGGFSPASLFAGGTVAGAWYDPSDLSTLFTTSAGTTPVAMPGQGSAVSVGLMLDKSQGLVLGSELVTNGDFSGGTTGWTAEPGVGVTLSAAGGVLTITQVGGTLYGRAYQALNGLTVGQVYQYTAQVVSNPGAQGVNIWAHSTFGGTPAAAQYGAGTSGTGNLVVRFRATATTMYVVMWFNTTAAGSVGFSNASVKALPGNHAIAFNDTTARPELRARVNLLERSEEFDNGYWTKGNASISANTNATTDPLGGNNADKLIEAANNAAHFVERNIGVLTGTFTASIYAKAAERTWLHVQLYPLVDGRAWFDLANGVLGTVDPAVTATITPAGNGWYKCTVSRNTGNTTFVNFYTSTGNNVSSYLGDGTSGIYIYGADLRPANIGANVPAYQRIADANTYDTSGFPLYLRFDGIDDSMYTPASIPFATVTSDGLARRNLLNNPTQFDVTTSWTVAAVTVTANTAVAPDGTTTADALVESAGTVQPVIYQTIASIAGVVSFYVKANGRNFVQIVNSASYANFDLSNGTVGSVAGFTNSAISSVGSGWYRISTVIPSSSVVGVALIGSGAATYRQSYTGDGTSGIYIWGAQLETGSTATAFQNIGTDKVAVFAGVRKLATTNAAGVIAELTSSWFSNAGTFVLYAPDGNAQNFGWGTRGNANTPYVAPLAATQTSYVATGTGDISGDVAQLRLNGAVAATSTTDQGAGNYGTYPLYIGARNNSSLWLNGQIYSLIIAGSAVSAGNISATEQWVAQRTGIAIP